MPIVAKDIEDVASDNVAYSQLGTAVNGRYDADDRFGRRCAEGNHGQYYDKHR